MPVHVAEPISFTYRYYETSGALMIRSIYKFGPGAHEDRPNYKHE